MGRWLGDKPISERDPVAVVIELQTEWIPQVIDLIGYRDTETYLTTLYSHDAFEREVDPNDQSLYEDELRNIIPFNFDKLKKFMELNYPWIWRGHDTLIGDPNDEFNEWIFKNFDNPILPLKEKFDGGLSSLQPGNWFTDRDGTMIGHNEYQIDENCGWDTTWYVPKGLYKFKYLQDIDMNTNQQAINYQKLKL